MTSTLIVLSLIAALVLAGFRMTAFDDLIEGRQVHRAQNKGLVGLAHIHVDLTATPITIPAGATYEIQLFKVEAGIVVKDLMTMIHTAEGEAATGEIGDDGDVDRFIDGAVAAFNLNAAAGTIVRLNNASFAGIGHRYTADNTIDLQITNGGGTPLVLGTGIFDVWMEYYQE